MDRSGPAIIVVIATAGYFYFGLPFEGAVVLMLAAIALMLGARATR